MPRIVKLRSKELKWAKSRGHLLLNLYKSSSDIAKTRYDTTGAAHLRLPLKTRLIFGTASASAELLYFYTDSRMPTAPAPKRLPN